LEQRPGSLVLAGLEVELSFTEIVCRALFALELPLQAELLVALKLGDERLDALSGWRVAVGLHERIEMLRQRAAGLDGQRADVLLRAGKGSIIEGLRRVAVRRVGQAKQATHLQAALFRFKQMQTATDLRVAAECGKLLTSEHTGGDVIEGRDVFIQRDRLEILLCFDVPIGLVDEVAGDLVKLLEQTGDPFAMDIGDGQPGRLKQMIVGGGIAALLEERGGLFDAMLERGTTFGERDDDSGGRTRPGRSPRARRRRRGTARRRGTRAAGRPSASAAELRRPADREDKDTHQHHRPG
jgi:hypothetical protein